jgi:hypothetical protein
MMQQSIVKSLSVITQLQMSNGMMIIKYDFEGDNENKSITQKTAECWLSVLVEKIFK